MHSPLPWKVVRSETPYYTWLMDAEGGMVAIGFSKTDEPGDTVLARAGG
jgi:hypothetical protein